MPGGTADVAGETIKYTITVANTGNATIARGGGRSVHADGRRCVPALQVGNNDRTIAGGRRDLAVHGQPHGDAGRARRRDGDIVNTATVIGTGASPDTDDASVPVVQSKILHIEKDATVADGTANVGRRRHQLHAGGDQPGNAAIAGVVVDDPFTTNEAPVLVGGFNVGDTDEDNLLDVGETWQYTASHQVTQAELDAGTAIVNTATVTGTGATSDTDDASVPVAQTPALTIVKSLTNADDAVVDTAGRDRWAQV